MLALSQADVKDFPLVKVYGFDKKIFLLSTVISELWVARINLFGYAPPEAKVLVFSNEDTVIAPTAAWTDLSTSTIDGFTKKTLFVEGDDGAHDLCKSIKNHFLKAGHGKLQWQ
jgi:hypothetical protein